MKTLINFRFRFFRMKYGMQVTNLHQMAQERENNADQIGKRQQIDQFQHRIIIITFNRHHVKRTRDAGEPRQMCFVQKPAKKVRERKRRGIDEQIN